MEQAQVFIKNGSRDILFEEQKNSDFGGGWGEWGGRRRVDVWTCVDGGLDGWMDGSMDVWMDGWMVIG